MNLRDATMYVYAYGGDEYLNGVIGACLGLGLKAQPGSPDFWEREDPAGTVEAIRLNSGSSRAVLVCRSGLSWKALQQEWSRSQLQAPDRVGEVHVLYAVYAGSPAEQDAVAVACGLSADAVALATPWPGVHLWENGTGRDRILTLVGPLLSWERMEAWIWPAGRTLPAPLPALLWQAARLRQEERTFGENAKEIRKRLVALHRQAAGLLAAGPVRRTEQTMLRLHWDTAHVAADEALLRAQAVAVEAIRSELAAADPDGRAGDLLDGDADLGRWLAVEIADLADSAHAAVAYAEPVAGAVRAGDNYLVQSLAERTQYYVTVQAAAIGALLVVLATVQSISYKWPTAEYLKLPVTVVLGLLALVIPIWAGWRPTADAPDRRTPRWLAAPAVTAAAAIAWLAATAVSHALTGHPAPATLSGPAAAAAAAAALLLVSVGRLRTTQKLTGSSVPDPG